MVKIEVDEAEYADMKRKIREMEEELRHIFAETFELGSGPEDAETPLGGVQGVIERMRDAEADVERLKEVIVGMRRSAKREAWRQYVCAILKKPEKRTAAEEADRLVQQEEERFGPFLDGPKS